MAETERLEGGTKRIITDTPSDQRMDIEESPDWKLESVDIIQNNRKSGNADRIQNDQGGGSVKNGKSGQNSRRTGSEKSGKNGRNGEKAGKVKSGKNGQRIQNTRSGRNSSKQRGPPG